MTKRTVTICWGLGAALVLGLPYASRASLSSGQAVPQSVPPPFPQATAPPPPTPSSPPALAPPLALPLPYELAWEIDAPAGGQLDLVIGRTVLIAVGPDADLRAYALGDGRLVWTHETRAIVPPVVSAGLVFVVAGGHVHAFDEETGSVRWTMPLEVATQSPTALAETILVPNGTGIHALRTKDGTESWRRDFGAPAVTPVVTDGPLAVVGLENNTLVALDVQTGTIRWRTLLDNGFVRARPRRLTAGYGRVYFGTSTGSACSHRLTNGVQDWCHPVGVPTIGTPAVDERYAYFALLDNTVRMFDRRGAQRRNEPLAARPAAGLLRLGDRLAIPLASGEFVLLGPGDGRPTVIQAPHAAESSRTLGAAAVAADGRMLASVTVTPGLSRLLAAYRRTPPPPAPAGAPVATPPAGDLPAK